MLRNPVRCVGLLLLGLALLAMWQATSLRTWAFDGPGPGLFPQFLAGLCILLCLVELVAPEQPKQTSALQDIGPSHADAEPAEKRAFLVYAIALLVMIAGAYYAGFALTTFALVVIILHYGERIPWRKAVGFAALYVVGGWVVFAWLLRVNLPEGPLDRTFLALVY